MQRCVFDRDWCSCSVNDDDGDDILKMSVMFFFSILCFYTVGWTTGRASCCWFVGGDDLTGVLHILIL